jgi:acetyltransferase-like isoleucine patch superfamily enzyme
MTRWFYMFHFRCTRLWSRVFTFLIKSNFAEFGKGSVIRSPADIRGISRIAIGANVYIGSGALLYALSYKNAKDVCIRFGHRVAITGQCTISAVQDVVIEDDVLIARNVYISDHSHHFSSLGTPVRNQGVDKVSPVRIKRGAWLGQNVVVCPGVTIGTGSVVGANSVVKSDVPDYCIAAGAPAVVRRDLRVSNVQLP